MVQCEERSRQVKVEMTGIFQLHHVLIDHPSSKYSRKDRTTCEVVRSGQGNLLGWVELIQCRSSNIDLED